MPASARLVWSPGVEVIADGIDAWVAQGRARLASELLQVGEEMRAYAQLNHPWTNRTGEAEAELGYAVDDGGDVIELTIYQGAPHGIWLEVKYGGRWGILPETMMQGYGRVLQAVASAFG